MRSLVPSKRTAARLFIALATTVGRLAESACAALDVDPLIHSAKGPTASAPASNTRVRPLVTGTPLEDELDELDEDVLADELELATPEDALELDDVELPEDEELEEFDAPLPELDEELEEAPELDELELDAVGVGFCGFPPEFLLSPESLHACRKKLAQSKPTLKKVLLELRTIMWIPR